MMESSGAGPGLPRAFLRVGGVSVARRQLTLALALECQRVICIARGVDPELIALQHEAERRGARFHIVTGARGLVPLVTANDEVVALADGLLVSPRDAAAMFEGGSGVMVQPIEGGLAAGFERIDLNHAAAGILHVPGRLVDRLNELPADCDVLSALTRIALQAGVPQRMVPAPLREGVRWRIVRDEAEAHAIEAAWFRLQMAGEGRRTPGGLLARGAVLTFGPALVHGGNGTLSTVLAAVAGMLLATCAGWFGMVTVGFILATLAWLLGRMSSHLYRVEHESAGRAPAQLPGERLLFIGIDILLVLLATWSAPEAAGEVAGQGYADRAFLPVMLIGIVRLLDATVPGAWVAWANDRAVLGIVLAGAALSGSLHPVMQGLAIVLLMAGIATTGWRRRLTHT